MAKVTALGELLIDFVSSGNAENKYPVLQANPGGAPANYLAALSAYGIETAFIGNVGNDAFGKMLKSTLEERSIDVSCLTMDPDLFTTLAFVTLDGSGNREFSFARKPGADTNIKLNEKSIELIKSSDVFHFGTLSLTDEPARSATVEAVKIAEKNGKIISCDPNYRAPLWKNEEEARKWLAWACSNADIVKISDEEAKFIYNANEEKSSEIILSGKCRLCLVTLGSKGCYYATKDFSGFVSAPKVNSVDTTGAGDIFGGAFMSSFLKNSLSLDSLNEKDVADAAEFAVTAASLSTEHFGGISSVVDEDSVSSQMLCKLN